VFHAKNFEEFFMISKRITIVLDDALVKKLRVIQSKKISKSTEHVSFSRIINEELRRALK
jgi:hypothetical protein